MFTYKRRVKFYETDGMRVVHHANYLRYFEEARVEYLRAGGIKCWRADGKACQQKKPAGSADSWLANVKKMKDRTQKKHCSDVVPDGVFLL